MVVVELGRNRGILSFHYTSPFVISATIGPYTVDQSLLTAFPGLAEARKLIEVSGVSDTAGENYQPVSTESSVNILGGRYYWDSENQTIYIHTYHDDDPRGIILYLAQNIQGFTNGSMVTINSVEYEPRVVSIPPIRQQQDIVDSGALSLINSTVVLDNRDGELDDIIDLPVYGNSLDIHVLDYQAGKDEYTRDDMTQLFALTVDKPDFTVNELALKVQDKRISDNVTIPTLRFTSAEYPDMEPDLVGTVVPVVFGVRREIPGICTNGTLTSGNVSYRFCETITNTSPAVTYYVDTDGNGNWVAKTPLTESLVTGEATFSAANARDANGNVLQCKAVGVYGINTGDGVPAPNTIIQDLNTKYLGIPFNTDNYKIGTAWESFTSEHAEGIYIASETKLFDVIGQLQNGSQGLFRYDFAQDGRRRLVIDDETKEPRYFIDRESIWNRDALSVSPDKDNLAASVVVRYAKSDVSGRHMTVTDDSAVVQVLADYGQRPLKSVETNLYTSSGAQARADNIIERFSTVRGIVELEIAGAEYQDIAIYDILECDLSPDDTRTYFGTRKIKVLSTAPDPVSLINTISGVIIN